MLRPHLEHCQKDTSLFFKSNINLISDPLFSSIIFNLVKKNQHEKLLIENKFKMKNILLLLFLIQYFICFLPVESCDLHENKINTTKICNMTIKVVNS